MVESSCYGCHLVVQSSKKGNGDRYRVGYYLLISVTVAEHIWISMSSMCALIDSAKKKADCFFPHFCSYLVVYGILLFSWN